jgi:hypothetical protein
MPVTPACTQSTSKLERRRNKLSAKHVRFMDLSYAEVGYFITQVALSAASFGVAQSDLQIVGTALGSLFDVRCAPPTVIIPAQGAQLQSICTDMTCPLAVNATCAKYETNITEPATATVSSMASTGTASATASSSSKAATPSTAAAAAGAYPAAVAAFGALLAFLL